MCVIRIDNLGCEVRLKPEFKTRHSSFNITQGDFIAQYLDPQTMIWENIDYSIDSNGDADLSLNQYGTNLTWTDASNDLPSGSDAVAMLDAHVWKVKITLTGM